MSASGLSRRFAQVAHIRKDVEVAILRPKCRAERLLASWSRLPSPSAMFTG